MDRVTKKELNQHTAQVLERVTPHHELVVTERGKPRWHVTAYEPTPNVLDRLAREGHYTPPTASFSDPWPDEDLIERTYTSAEVDALLDEMKGDH